MPTLPPSMFGQPALRSEDPRFLTGRGRYLENLPIEGVLRAVFVRSMMPHARVIAVDVDAARAMPGVVAVYTADDLAIRAMPPSGNVEGASGTLEGPFGREVIARDVVRFVGEPLALVVAESLAVGQDAAEIVLPDLEPMAAVTDVEAAIADDAPLLWPDHGSNVADAFEVRWDDDVLAGSDVVARGRFVNQRVAPVPMEPNAIAVAPDGDGGFTVWVSTQVPFDVRDDMAELLEVRKDQVRTIAPDVGGGFGAKLQIYPEYQAVAVAAAKLGRPIRWVETRSESMLGLTHGRAQVQLVEIGAKRDGTIVGVRADLLADMGAYPIGAFLPTTTQEMLGGVYTIRDVACRGRSIVTNATPVAPYRGAGRPEAAALIERAIDLVAAELGLDAVDVRRKNLIPADAFPYESASGTVYDIGDYAKALDEALRIAGMDALRAEQAARRARGDHVELGIGLATYVEITSFMSKEFGAVEVATDGTVTVHTGTSPHGQGHETAFAQIASAVLGVPFDVGARGAQRHRHRPPRRRHVGVTVAAGRRVVGPRAQRRGRGEGPHARRSSARGRRGRSRPGRWWSGGGRSARPARSPGPSWRRPPPTVRGSRQGWNRGSVPRACIANPPRPSRSGPTSRWSRSTPRPGTCAWCATSPWTTADGS